MVRVWLALLHPLVRQKSLRTSNREIVNQKVETPLMERSIAVHKGRTSLVLPPNRRIAAPCLPLVKIPESPVRIYAPVLACSYPTPGGITINIGWSERNHRSRAFDEPPLDNVFPLVDTVTASLI
jgi:hypothetical protein